MRAHPGLGPVFGVEWLIFARKWQGYATRFLFGGLLLAGIALCSWSIGELSPTGKSLTIGKLSEFGALLFTTMGAIQLLTVLLVAPATTAGAMCQDRARGTLTHMAMTDLSNSEIILGMLAARLIPVLGLILCSLPVMFLSSLLGGIDPTAICALFVISVAMGVLGCSLAMTLSLWTKKTHETLMAVFGLWIGWVLFASLWDFFGPIVGLGGCPAWVYELNPLAILYCIYYEPKFPTFTVVSIFAVAAFLISAGLVAVTITRLRRVLGNDGGSLRRGAERRWSFQRLFAPSLDQNPVLWREFHRNRPSRFARIMWGIYLFVAIFAMGFSIAKLFLNASSPRALTTIPELTPVNAIQLAFGFLLISILAPTALAEERVRGSLDLLMSTPLSSRTILAGKWWGTFRIVLWLTIFPLVGAIALALAARTSTPAPVGRRVVDPIFLFDRVVYVVLSVGNTLALGAAITSLGLALATLSRRVGRAIGVTVTAYILVAAGWPLLLVLLADQLVTLLGSTPDGRVLGIDAELILVGIMSLSPAASSFYRDVAMIAPLTFQERVIIWVVEALWTVGMGLFARTVYEITVRIFDGKLGRVSETGAAKGTSSPSGRKRRRSSSVDAVAGLSTQVSR